jgi:hypothetical protein
VAIIVHEYMGMIGDFDAKWGEFDNRAPAYRAKLILRSPVAIRLAVAFGGKRRANIKQCAADQLYVLDLDPYVNSDDGNLNVRVLFNGNVLECAVRDLWSAEEEVVKVCDLIAG